MFRHKGLGCIAHTLSLLPRMDEGQKVSSTCPPSPSSLWINVVFIHVAPIKLKHECSPHYDVSHIFSVYFMMCNLKIEKKITHEHEDKSPSLFAKLRTSGDFVEPLHYTGATT